MSENWVEEEQCRLDERHRIAKLIEDNAEAIAEFASDKERAVRLTALTLRWGMVPGPIADEHRRAHWPKPPEAVGP